VALRERTDPVVVCLDADVIVAGFFSKAGASYVVLLLAEVGLLRTVLPSAVVDEVTRNLQAKLPDALPSFDRFLKAPFVQVHRPGRAQLHEARALAHVKDVPVMAAALGSRATHLVTHNVRHFRSTRNLKVVRPRGLVEQLRAWIAKLGP
jgi:predicted nucleic acid-binding protein